jgi:DNA-directed RNA polymerase specialized sigma subunit
MGSERFVEQVAPLLHEMEKQTEIPRQERLAGRPSLEELFSGVTGKPLRDRKIYEVTRQYEYTLTEIQEHLGLHYSTISRIASRVEEQQRSKDKI